jgi:hypothetical protein
MNENHKLEIKQNIQVERKTRATAIKFKLLLELRTCLSFFAFLFETTKIVEKRHVSTVRNFERQHNKKMLVNT